MPDPNPPDTEPDRGRLAELFRAFLNVRKPIPRAGPPWKDMSPAERSAIGQRWRDEGSRLAAELNAFLKRLSQSIGPGDLGAEPKDTRSDLAEIVLEALREANDSGELAGFRERFPPAYFPFSEHLDENGQPMDPLVLLDDEQIVVRAGGARYPVTTYLIDDSHVETLPGVLSVGRSPDRRYFAVARETGITIHQGWDGPVVTRLDWPTTGTPGPRHERYDWDCNKVTSLDWPTPGTREAVATYSPMIPFPDGRRVLLANRSAIMVVEPQCTTILWPREREELEGIVGLNNPHGAVSPDGSLIVIGDRNFSKHIIFNDRYEPVGHIAGLADLSPWHASFSDDGRSLALSSFTPYQGATVLVPTRRFPGLVVEAEDLQKHWYSKDTWTEARQALRDFDRDLVVLDSSASAYASAWRPGEFILGDAQGYLRAFDRDGETRWDHYIGSTVNGIDVSTDGRRLVASTYAGLVVALDLDIGEPDPYRIGTSTHRERRRWLFWRNEKKPLAWWNR